MGWDRMASTTPTLPITTTTGPTTATATATTYLVDLQAAVLSRINLWADERRSQHYVVSVQALQVSFQSFRVNVVPYKGCRGGRARLSVSGVRYERRREKLRVSSSPSIP